MTTLDHLRTYGDDDVTFGILCPICQMYSTSVAFETLHPSNGQVLIKGCGHVLTHEAFIDFVAKPQLPQCIYCQATVYGYRLEGRRCFLRSKCSHAVDSTMELSVMLQRTVRYALIERKLTPTEALLIAIKERLS